MANVNEYPEYCDRCGKCRTCNDAGLCHECEQLEHDAAVIVIDGEEFIPGGYAL